MKLNCAIVALALWYQARFKSGIGVKRSEGLHGAIPHFFHIRERRRRNGLKPGIHSTDVFIEDFIPAHRKSRFMDDGDSFVLFDGWFRTRIYRLVAVSTAENLFGARRGAIAIARGTENRRAHKRALP